MLKFLTYGPRLDDLCWNLICVLKGLYARGFKKNKQTSGLYLLSRVTGIFTKCPLSTSLTSQSSFLVIPFKKEHFLPQQRQDTLNKQSLGTFFLKSEKGSIHRGLSSSFFFLSRGKYKQENMRGIWFTQHLFPLSVFAATENCPRILDTQGKTKL